MPTSIRRFPTRQAAPRVFPSLVAAVLLICVPALASAQSCPPLQFTGLSSQSSSCASDCCSAFTSCYAAAGCSMSYEWPKALRTECALCNQAFTTCTGLCLMVDAYAERYLNLQSEPECIPDCGTYSPREVLSCGITDGCGGICTGPELCSFFARRPEFIPVLLGR